MGSHKTRRQRRDAERREANREARKQARKLNKQRKAANTRAKYGPPRKPSPVIVTSLDGEVVRVVDQSKLR